MGALMGCRGSARASRRGSSRRAAMENDERGSSMDTLHISEAGIKEWRVMVCVDEALKGQVICRRFGAASHAFISLQTTTQEPPPPLSHSVHGISVVYFTYESCSWASITLLGVFILARLGSLFLVA
jgi:hypothetical protein